jgi:phosphatidylglycerol---prolipoprotein diacylglyceryl transferase
MSIQILGLTFYLYGFIIGIALLVGYAISRRQALKSGVLPAEWQWHAVAALGGGVVGARAYHGLTDWYLYKDNLLELLFVWRGGLSIIGAIAGSLVGLMIVHWRMKSNQSLWVVLDAMVCGLTIGQAIGRLGNFVNQELYGLPTSLPWGIFINPEHRLNGYEQFEFFHPLFAYEALALLFGAGMFYALYSGNRRQSGVAFLVYVIYYSIIRFCLDLLRINTTHKIFNTLTINQLVLSFVCCAAVSTLWMRLKTKR